MKKFSIDLFILIKMKYQRLSGKIHRSGANGMMQNALLPIIPDFIIEKTKQRSLFKNLLLKLVCSR
jgi:hypothetical protein